jgi:hypothetical protein
MIVFISADNDSAKKRVEALLESFGYSVIVERRGRKGSSPVDSEG